MPSVCAIASPIKISRKTLCVPMRKALLLHFLSSRLKAGESWWWQLLDIGMVETCRELGNSPQTLFSSRGYTQINREISMLSDYTHPPPP